MSDDVRKVKGGSRVVREPDPGPQSRKGKGTVEFTSPVDVHVVGPTDEPATKTASRAKKAPAKGDTAGK